MEEPIELVFVFVIPGLVLLLVLALVAAAQEHRLRDTLAAELELTHTGSGRLEGAYGATDQWVEVRAERRGGDDGDWWTEVRTTVDGPLPEGLAIQPRGTMVAWFESRASRGVRLGSDVDDVFQGQATRPTEARELLHDPQVRQWLAGVADAGGTVHLRNGVLKVARPEPLGSLTRSVVDQAVGLARALAEAHRRPWDRVAEQYGLRLDWSTPRLVGMVRGVAIEVEARPDGVTTVHALLRAPLPPGTAIVHREGTGKAAVLGDPVLDQTVAVRCHDLDALRPRLCQERVREPLLEVVHGHPGSAVTSESVRLVHQGWLGQALASRLQLVLELVDALGSEDAQDAVHA